MSETDPEPTTTVATYEPPDRDVGHLLWDPAAFEHSQRLAKMFASSQLIPKHLQGKVADVTIALQLAYRIDEDPLTVMQSIYIVHGRPGWAATYIIARAKRAGISIRWEVKRGEQPLKFKRKVKNGGTVNAEMPDLTVTARTKLPGDTDTVEVTLSSRTAIADGWANNEKYSTIAEQMLCYRTATFLVRRYAPEILLGLPTAIEVEDQRAVEVVAPATVAIVQQANEASEKATLRVRVAELRAKLSEEDFQAACHAVGLTTPGRAGPDRLRGLIQVLEQALVNTPAGSPFAGEPEPDADSDGAPISDGDRDLGGMP